MPQDNDVEFDTEAGSYIKERCSCHAPLVFLKILETYASQWFGFGRVVQTMPSSSMIPKFYRQ
jgi:hypothetical protein